ncbi:MAG: hypothetical protein ACREQ5_00075 [Candidatus Dormibacteria bacterium]
MSTEDQGSAHRRVDQGTEERLAAAARMEGVEGDGGHTDPEGFPVHAGHAAVAGLDNEKTSGANDPQDPSEAREAVDKEAHPENQ